MITGSLVALVTPMHSDGAIDWMALDKLIDFHLHNGTDGLVTVGTTGESATLDHNEHCQVIKHVVQQVNKRIAVVAGTGANSTTEAIHLTAAAKQTGADACLLVTPYYNKPSQEGLYEHYKLIAEKVDIPQILYNVPSRTACDILPDTVLRLAVIDNIIGIKEATGDLQRAKTLIDQCPADFAVYSGDDSTAVELILAGGHGNISVTANIVPQTVSNMCQLAIENHADKARIINEALMPLHRYLFVEANPIPVKWALHTMGLIDKGIRLPLTILADEFQQQLSTLLIAQGININ